MKCVSVFVKFLYSLKFLLRQFDKMSIIALPRVCILGSLDPNNNPHSIDALQRYYIYILATNSVHALFKKNIGFTNIWPSVFFVNDFCRAIIF